MPPPYEDKTLPTDEWCACGKNLWKLTEVNINWHLHGKGRPGGGMLGVQDCGTPLHLSLVSNIVSL